MSRQASAADRRPDKPGKGERIAIARTAIVLAWLLDATAIALAFCASLVHQQAIYLGVHGANAGAVTSLLTLGGLALLGAVASGIAAVGQRPRRVSTWLALVASGIGLLALLLSTIPIR